MKTYLESQHRERIESPGWNATIIDFHRNGAVLRIRGTEYTLIRSGNGFMPHCCGKPIWEKPEYPDAAIAVVYRHQYM